jgi:selenide,water dikinase
MNVESIRLTELSACAGCAAKLGAAELRSVMERVSPATNARVLVGYGDSDDAGVYLLRDDIGLVQTVDFFTPIVDDPYDFGRIAATNALSDVYAMGGRPLSALNIVAFPEDLDLSILAQILEGGASVARDAGVAILGGHTIKDAEPKYGMTVTGIVDPQRIVTNAGARNGDALVLTKPLGTGMLTTARKRGSLASEELDEAIAAMTTLNDRAAEAMLAAGAHAATDITGFRLLGHAENMARASRARLILDSTVVPFMKRVLALIADGVVPGGTRHNAQTHATFTDFTPSVPPEVRVGLSDAQTSGGLLISIARENLAMLLAELSDRSTMAAVVGEVCSGSGIEVIA